MLHRSHLIYSLPKAVEIFIVQKTGAHTPRVLRNQICSECSKGIASLEYIVIIISLFEALHEFQSFLMRNRQKICHQPFREKIIQQRATKSMMVMSNF